MAEGGWGSGAWGEAAWGGSVYYRDAAETATTSDSEAVAGSTFTSAIVATGQIVDNIATTPTLFAGVEEQEAIGSVVLVATGTFNVSLSDAAAVSDANSAQQVFATEVSESSTGADAVATQQVFASEVSESATGADALDSSFAYFSDVNETVTATDENAAQHVMPVSVDESATGSDAVSTNQILETAVSEGAAASVRAVISASIFYASLVDNVIVADLIAARRFWEPVDDIQNANWQNITNTQNPAWTDVVTQES
jgi:hypothetical protein